MTVGFSVKGGGDIIDQFGDVSRPANVCQMSLLVQFFSYCDNVDGLVAVVQGDKGFPDPLGWLLFGLTWLQSAASIVYAYLRLAQRELSESREKYRSMMESMTSMLSRWTASISFICGLLLLRGPTVWRIPTLQARTWPEAGR